MYYDYDQGDLGYRSTHWGKLFQHQTLKFTSGQKVQCRRISNAVENNVEMFGVVALGTYLYTMNCYKKMNHTIPVEEWDATLGMYAYMLLFG